MLKNRLCKAADLPLLRIQLAQLAEVLGEQARPRLSQERPPPRAAVAMVAIEALVEERSPRLREPLVEVVEADLVVHLRGHEQPHRGRRALSNPAGEAAVRRVRELRHAEELVRDGDRKAAARERRALVEVRREEDERAAVPLRRQEREPVEVRAAEVLDVDVRLAVRAVQVDQRRTEAVRRVVREG